MVFLIQTNSLNRQSHNKTMQFNPEYDFSRLIYIFKLLWDWEAWNWKSHDFVKIKKIIWFVILGQNCIVQSLYLLYIIRRDSGKLLRNPQWGFYKLDRKRMFNLVYRQIFHINLKFD